MSLECLYCQKGVREGITLYRINELGVDGVWACERHLKQTDVAIDEDVFALTKIIEGKETRDE